MTLSLSILDIPLKAEDPVMMKRTMKIGRNNNERCILGKLLTEKERLKTEFGVDLLIMQEQEKTKRGNQREKSEN